jgi:O-antigen/teichoic acid export membrane protein
MAFSGMVLNIVMNLILIPRFQALGSAISSLSTQTFTAIIQVIIAFRIFRFNINYKLLFLLLIFASGVTLFGVIATDLPYNWTISMVIMIVLSFILAFSIGLIKIKDMYQIIKNDK